MAIQLASLVVLFNINLISPFSFPWKILMNWNIKITTSHKETLKITIIDWTIDSYKIKKNYMVAELPSVFALFKEA